ncbi:MAG: glucuronate isomerase [Oscillospiraceae bacterium]|jgi:glucuronate isomerase|nr:glucuronate isomerase [Oscillospiraceae bacterium]
MRAFLDRDFLLENEPARRMFAAADEMPILDWHCHLSPREIYENRPPEDLAALWLGGDHYKWRAMRSCGVPEEKVTGAAAGEEKFGAWAACLPKLIGNPLYHWAHLELQRYFGIEEPLGPASSARIWREANGKIAAGGFAPRDLIAQSRVTHVFTTDDPADSLEYHALLQGEALPFRVLPAFRPDKALAIDHLQFPDWLKALEKTAGAAISSFEDLAAVLAERIHFFGSLGCRASDHAFSYVPFTSAAPEQVEAVFQKRLRGEFLHPVEADQYKTALLRVLAKEYAARGWVMELHLGPMRNNSTRRFLALGPDTGFDSIDDWPIAQPLSRLLDSLDAEEALPKTILFNLNPKDSYVLAAMIGNFQTDEYPGKLQFGPAWWFLDHIDGMTEQLRTLANLGALGTFVGMTTDSRSFLSYPRHEYFRRIFCAFCGSLVERGLFPADEAALAQLARDVAYGNAAAYFSV